MQLTVTKVINDARYYSPKAIKGRACQFMEFGKLHDTTVEFSISKIGDLGESIWLKSPKTKRFRQITFDWVVGGYDEQGTRKVGASFLYKGNGLEFSLYLHELVNLLKELQSQREIVLWEGQLQNQNDQSDLSNHHSNIIL